MEENKKENNEKVEQELNPETQEVEEKGNPEELNNNL